MAIHMTDERAITIHTQAYNYLQNNNYTSSEKLAKEVLPNNDVPTAKRLLRVAIEKCLSQRLTEQAIYSISTKGKGYFIQTKDNYDDVQHAINETLSRSEKLKVKGTSLMTYSRKFVVENQGWTEND